MAQAQIGLGAAAQRAGVETQTCLPHLAEALLLLHRGESEGGFWKLLQRWGEGAAEV